LRAVESPSFFYRLWFSWIVYFRVLFDGAFAGRVLAASQGKELPAPNAKSPEKTEAPALAPKSAAPKETPKPKEKDDHASALALLALLQREGRFVDFLEEDVASFPDADIGAAARVVHSGCRKALREHVKLAPIREEEEGKKVTLAEGFNRGEVKLTGNVSGKAPFTGAIVHRGWRAESITLPESVEGHDARVLAQAEVEIA
jgi:hypothetical protein